MLYLRKKNILVHKVRTLQRYITSTGRISMVDTFTETFMLRKCELARFTTRRERTSGCPTRYKYISVL